MSSSSSALVQGSSASKQADKRSAPLGMLVARIASLKVEQQARVHVENSQRPALVVPPLADAKGGGGVDVAVVAQS